MDSYLHPTDNSRASNENVPFTIIFTARMHHTFCTLPSMHRVNEDMHSWRQALGSRSMRIPIRHSWVHPPADETNSKDVNLVKTISKSRCPRLSTFDPRTNKRSRLPLRDRGANVP